MPLNSRNSHLFRDVERKLRDPAFVADLRRQAALMAQHPQNAEIDDWIEQVTDYSDWGPYDWPDSKTES